MPRPRLIPILLVSVLLAPAASRGSALDTDVLAAEIDRLGTLVSDPELGQSGEQLRSIHQEAAEALRRGRPHWALQRLQLGLVMTASYHYMAEQQKRVADFDGFEKLWRAQDRTLERARLAGRDPSCRHAPGLVRALVERAANRAGRHYQAARAMARAADASSGLFYLGHARAEVDLVRLCELFRAAAAVDPPVPPAPASLEELPALEEATALAYAVPGAAIDRHDDFIGLNASLKELRELGEAGLSHGAFALFLDATLRLSLLAASSPEAAAAGDIDRLATLLDGDGRDHSIALAYLERAASVLDDPDADGKDRATAESIVSRVLPEYLDRVGLAEP